MAKMKTLILCVLTGLLTFGLTLGVIDYNHKSNPTSLVITGPSMVNKGDIIDFEASVSNPSWFLSSTVYQWKVLHKDGEVKFNTVGNNKIYFPSGLNSDKFYVVISAVNYHNYLLWGNTQPVDIKVNVVTVGDPVPVPPTPTPPNPNPPTPTPVVTAHLYAIFIHDSTTDLNLTPGQLAVKKSQTIQAKLKQLDAEWKVYDKANPALADSKWQAAITKAGLPGLFIVDKDGKQYNVGNEKITNEDSTVLAVQSLRSGK